MAVINQPTGIFDMENINNSSSNKSRLKIMIMNTGGKDAGDNPTDRRKQTIYDVVMKTRAALVLFQEFKWKGIRSPAWKDYSWPGHLQYTGNNDASILFDETKVTGRIVSKSARRYSSRTYQNERHSARIYTDSKDVS